MFNRITADLLFTTEDEANDFYHDCHLAILKSQTINPRQPNEERGIIQQHLCNHDQPSVLNCELVRQQLSPLPPP